MYFCIVGSVGSRSPMRATEYVCLCPRGCRVRVHGTVTCDYCSCVCAVSKDGELSEDPQTYAGYVAIFSEEGMEVRAVEAMGACECICCSRAAGGGGCGAAGGGGGGGAAGGGGAGGGAAGGGGEVAAPTITQMREAARRDQHGLVVKRQRDEGETAARSMVRPERTPASCTGLLQWCLL